MFIAKRRRGGGEANVWTQIKIYFEAVHVSSREKRRGSKCIDKDKDILKFNISFQSDCRNYFFYSI